MTLVIQTILFSSWTMGKWYVVISNVVEKVNFTLIKHQRCCNAVNWSIAPSLIEETTVTIKMFEIIDVGL